LRYCASCAAENAIDSAESIKAKSGPAYERNVHGQLAHWQREAARLGLKPPD
jgi:hypothetical protein